MYHYVLPKQWPFRNCQGQPVSLLLQGHKTSPVLLSYFSLFFLQFFSSFGRPICDERTMKCPCPSVRSRRTPVNILRTSEDISMTIARDTLGSVGSRTQLSLRCNFSDYVLRNSYMFRPMVAIFRLSWEYLRATVSYIARIM